MSTRPQQQLVLSYIVPLVLTIVILAISQLLNLVKLTHLLEACGLCAVVIVGLFIGQYVAFKTLRMQERDALYGILSTISFSSGHYSPNAAVLTESEVLSIESAAHEVWIYAYDLEYERFDRGRSPFTNAVAANLQREARYVYLIPSSSEVINRACRMSEYLAQFVKGSKQLEFRVSSIAPQFNNFSVTLYNPDTTLRRPSDTGSDQDCNTIAIFFPHAKHFVSTGVPTPFLAVRDRNALDIQEKLESLLKDSTILTTEDKR